jgi:hypothetical protein
MDGQSLDARVKQLRAAGAGKVLRETPNGGKTGRAQLRCVLGQLEKGDVLMVTRRDRLARSTRDLLNTLAAILGKGAGFRSLNDAWADTTTAHGRLMLTVLGWLAEFERELIRARTGEGRARLHAPSTHGCLSSLPYAAWQKKFLVLVHPQNSTTALSMSPRSALSMTCCFVRRRTNSRRFAVL